MDNGLSYDPDFCWNDWLAKPFTELGMRQWCVILLQGMALSKFFQGVGNKDGNFVSTP
jgi:hypothetical protein